MIQELSTQLLALKKEIAEIEERQSLEIDPKKEQLKMLQGKFIDALTAQGLKSIKTEQANFAIASRHGFKFINEIAAMKWAIKNKAISIDSRLAAQKLKDVEVLPDFIQKVESNYLTIKETIKK